MSRAKDSTADRAVRESKTEFNGRREQHTHIGIMPAHPPPGIFETAAPASPPAGADLFWGAHARGITANRSGVTPRPRHTQRYGR